FFLHYILTRSLFPRATPLLIDHRARESHVAVRGSQYEIALRIEFQFLRTLNAQRNDVGIGARRDDKIVFELSLAAVEHEVGAGIHSLIFHARVCRDVATPSTRIA